MDAGLATAERLERCFAEIGAQRMAGVPILNAALRVKAVGMREWQGHWLSALVTPWFLNVMLLPRESGAENPAIGSKRLFAFPAGTFEFIRGHEPVLGGYWMCSLFSPVLEFTDQEAAEATAAASLDALLTAEAEDAAADDGMAMIWRGELPAAPEPEVQGEAPAGVSRRAFLGAQPSDVERQP